MMTAFIQHYSPLSSRLTALTSDPTDDDELMLNVLRCHLTS